MESGRAIIKDALARAGQMSKYHNSPTTWAEKADTWEGRTCMHVSKGSKTFPSINSSIDDEASDAHYPFEALPLLPEDYPVRYFVFVVRKSSTIFKYSE